MLQSSSRGGVSAWSEGAGSAWSGGDLPGWGGSPWSWGGFSLLGGSPLSGGVLLGPWGGSLETPPVDRITDACKNITLATTSLQPVINQ